MSQKVTDVMIAGYLIKEPAMLDYEAVIKSGAKIEGMGGKRGQESEKYKRVVSISASLGTANSRC